MSKLTEFLAAPAFADADLPPILAALAVHACVHGRPFAGPNVSRPEVITGVSLESHFQNSLDCFDSNGKKPATHSWCAAVETLRCLGSNHPLVSMFDAEPALAKPLFAMRGFVRWRWQKIWHVADVLRRDGFMHWEEVNRFVVGNQKGIAA
jgi:hypothetical protein